MQDKNRRWRMVPRLCAMSSPRTVLTLLLEKVGTVHLGFCAAFAGCVQGQSQHKWHSSATLQGFPITSAAASCAADFFYLLHHNCGILLPMGNHDGIISMQAAARRWLLETGKRGGETRGKGGRGGNRGGGGGESRRKIKG